MSKAFRLTASTGIHKGDRDYQQDQVALLAHQRYNGCVLGVLADGMGGRSGGRKASDQVMMTARQLFERREKLRRHRQCTFQISFRQAELAAAGAANAFV